MTVISVPDTIRLRQVGQWELVTATTTPGPGLDGRQQYIFRENRTWRCGYKVFDAWGKRASWGAYLAFLDQLRGPANVFDIEVPNVNAIITGAGEPLFVFEGPNMVFESGTNNAVVLDSDPNPVTTVAAPEGATIIQLGGVDGSVLGPGAHFAYLNFLYRVAANNDGEVAFNPPLRTAIPSGTMLQVRKPFIRVRLADDAAAAAAHQFSQIGGAYTLNVVEAFER